MYLGSLIFALSSADGFVVGTTSTSDRVNLFGNAVVFAEPEPNGIDFALTDDTGSGNRHRDQGQVLISQSQVTNSAGYGVIVEDALRDLPSYDWFDPAKEEFHSQYSVGDYTPHPGPVRNLRELNPEHLTTGVSIVSNVIALNGEGGISYGGDPNGFVIVAPVADEEGDAGEVWDEFMFDIIDHNGLTRRFEFHDLQQNANPVAGTDYQAGNIPVFFDRAPGLPLRNRSLRASLLSDL